MPVLSESLQRCRLSVTCRALGQGYLLLINVWSWKLERPIRKRPSPPSKNSSLERVGPRPVIMTVRSAAQCLMLANKGTMEHR